MEHKDSTIRAEMLVNEIAEIKANMASVASRIANLQPGPVRAEFERDHADLVEELATREKELTAVTSGSSGSDSLDIRREMLRDEISDTQANIKTCEERMALAPGAARDIYEAQVTDLKQELEELRSKLAALG
jgi:hypothetical protein